MRNEAHKFDPGFDALLALSVDAEKYRLGNPEFTRHALDIISKHIQGDGESSKVPVENKNVG